MKKLTNDKDNKLTRSNEPIFWGLFSAGGMWAAIFAPIVIVIFGYFVPFGSVVTRSRILYLAETWGGKGFLLLMITLPLWCALHRILHTLHDFNIHIRHEKPLTYGLALLWTLHAIYILFLR